MGKRFKVTFPMADPEDIKLAREVAAREIVLPAGDASVMMNPKEVTEEDIRRTADTIAALDQESRAEACRDLLACLVETGIDARRLAGVVMMFHSQIQKSQAEMTRASLVHFQPPRG